MAKSSHEIFLELETLAIDLKGATAFQHSAACLSINGDFEIPAEEWTASAALVSRQAAELHRTLYEYWEAHKAESTDNKKPA